MCHIMVSSCSINEPFLLARPVCDLSLFRSACPTCRLAACIDAGMRPEQVLTDADRVDKYNGKRKSGEQVNLENKVKEQQREGLTLTPGSQLEVKQIRRRVKWNQQGTKKSTKPKSKSKPKSKRCKKATFQPEIRFELRQRWLSPFYYGSAVESPPWMTATQERGHVSHQNTPPPNDPLETDQNHSRNQNLQAGGDADSYHLNSYCYYQSPVVSPPWIEQ